jgi:hypothetical protein
MIEALLRKIIETLIALQMKKSIRTMKKNSKLKESVVKW